jgi:manganese/zinc/iron transport system substrate-binding protein
MEVRRITLRLLIALTPVLIGCGTSPSTPATGERIQQHQGTGPIRVVCTTNILKDLVRQIGGERVQVTAIMDGPGIDPHTYTPSPKDTNALTAADLVVYSGLHLEGQFDEALESLKFRGIPVICVTEKLTQETPSRLIQTEEGAADPHVWFSPDLWSTCGECLAEGLSAYDSENAEQYSAAATAFSEQLAQAKHNGIMLLARIPDDRRVLVTAHDAFEYFALAFDFRVQAVQGISTDSEPGLRRINQLTDLLVERRISAVFTEQSVSDKNITALVANCASKGHTLKIGARLFSDTAGAEGTPEETLCGALLHNITQIAIALSESPGDIIMNDTEAKTQVAP